MPRYTDKDMQSIFDEAMDLARAARDTQTIARLLHVWEIRAKRMVELAAFTRLADQNERIVSHIVPE